jgi:hypothetical protein
MALKHVHECNAERPNISLLGIHVLVFYQLRCDVGQASDSNLGLLGRNPRNPEICQLWPPVLINQNVAWFDVTMANIHGMTESKRIKDLIRDRFEALEW